MGRWLTLVLMGLVTAGCQSEAEKCKKACYDEVAKCEAIADKAKKVKCEADLTEKAIDCARACDP